MSGIFKAYDIRGSYPDELDELTARKIGASLVSLLKARRMVVGRDMRHSASALAQAFIEGTISAGASVTDIGMVTTPMLYYAIIAGKFEGGAMVTASHLPGGMNGFKLCREAAIPLSGDQGLPALEQMVRASPDVKLPVSLSERYLQVDYMDDYMTSLVRYVHNPRSLRIVVDAGNGMAGPEVLRLFKKFPSWHLVPMFMDPDGSFPHHIPNPLLPASTKELQERVIKEKADLGVAFDGDADRVGFIDENGERIAEDLVTALVAEFLLSKEPGAAILYDLRSSRVVPEVIGKLGGRALRCRVGHSFIKAKMREENALFAGELSGHYYFRDMGFTDNGIFATIQMLNFLSLKKQPLSRLIQPLKKYSDSGEINIRVKDKEAVFSALEAKFSDARLDHLDGLTAVYDSWWFNLRPSNTEPVIRLNIEADDPKVLEEKKRTVLKIIENSDPGRQVVG
jgi:phosphomannomutase